ncbi:MAG TPA: hypothetical protein VI229_00295 [Burkholderiales bacterium]
MTTQMQITDDAVSVRVPAGEYFLGDPCYFFTHDDWSKVLETCDTFNSPVGRAPNGDSVLGFGTKYGDGTYRDNEGREYGVDAGMLGLIPVGAITRERGEVERLCHRVKFAQPTLCVNFDGAMQFGRIRIDTRDGE